MHENIAVIGYYYTTLSGLEESDVGDQALAAATDYHRSIGFGLRETDNYNLLLSFYSNSFTIFFQNSSCTYIRKDEK